MRWWCCYCWGKDVFHNISSTLVDLVVPPTYRGSRQSVALVKLKGIRCLFIPSLKACSLIFQLSNQPPLPTLHHHAFHISQPRELKGKIEKGNLSIFLLIYASRFPDFPVWTKTFKLSRCIRTHTQSSRKFPQLSRSPLKASPHENKTASKLHKSSIVSRIQVNHWIIIRFQIPKRSKTHTRSIGNYRISYKSVLKYKTDFKPGEK